MTTPEEPDDGFAEHRAAVALLTIRLNHPPRDWVGDDEPLFHQIWNEATPDAEAEEGLLLSMMNLAWYALMYLEATAPERSELEWLQAIALDLEANDPGPD